MVIVLFVPDIVLLVSVAVALFFVASLVLSTLLSHTADLSSVCHDLSPLQYCAVVPAVIAHSFELNVFQLAELNQPSVDVVACHSFDFTVAVVSSPLLVPLVLPITVNCASVTYLLLVLSAISAVVASAHAVTNHLAS